MNITQTLLQKDGILTQHDEGEWGGTHSDYTAFNDAGLECETGEFMYGLLRILKPQNALETGTHFGVGASYMGMALQDNGFGHLDTIEFLPDIHTVAKKRIARLGLENQVTCHFGDVAKFEPTVTYDFILLDTEPQTRFAELLKFEPYLMPGGFLFIHDLHPHMHQIPNEEHGFAWPYGKIPKEMTKFVKDGKLRPFHFKTPRGLTGFYKVDMASDYKW